MDGQRVRGHHARARVEASASLGLPEGVINLLDLLVRRADLDE